MADEDMFVEHVDIIGTNLPTQQASPQNVSIPPASHASLTTGTAQHDAATSAFMHTAAGMTPPFQAEQQLGATTLPFAPAAHHPNTDSAPEQSPVPMQASSSHVSMPDQGHTAAAGSTPGADAVPLPDAQLAVASPSTTPGITIGEATTFQTDAQPSPLWHAALPHQSQGSGRPMHEATTTHGEATAMASVAVSVGNPVPVALPEWQTVMGTAVSPVDTSGQLLLQWHGMAPAAAPAPQLPNGAAEDAAQQAQEQPFSIMAPTPLWAQGAPGDAASSLEAQQAQQALLEALERARQLAYGTPAGNGVPYPEGAVAEGQQAAGVGGVYQVVSVSPDAVLPYSMAPPAAPTGNPTEEHGEHVVIGAGSAQQAEQEQQPQPQLQQAMNAAALQHAMLQQQWMQDSSSAVYAQAAGAGAGAAARGGGGAAACAAGSHDSGGGMPPHLTAEQQQHWLKIHSSQAPAAPPADPGAAPGHTHAGAAPAPDAAAPSPQPSNPAAQKRPPWLDVCYNHTPPEPVPFSPDGYVPPQGPAGAQASMQAAVAQAGGRWPKGARNGGGGGGAGRRAAVGVSPDALSNAAAAAGIAVADVGPTQAAGSQQQQPPHNATGAVYPVGAMGLDTPSLQPGHATTAACAPSPVVNIMSDEPEPHPSGLHPGADPSHGPPWIAIRSGGGGGPASPDGSHPLQYTAGVPGMPAGVPGVYMLEAAQPGERVCGAGGCGRRASEGQQYCWKHLVELNGQLDNQRLEQLAAAALQPQDDPHHPHLLLTAPPPHHPTTLALADPLSKPPSSSLPKPPPSSALAKPKSRARARRSTPTALIAICTVPDCRREARPELGNGGLCSFHAPNRARGRPDAPPCSDPDCRKKARLCADGQMLYCLEHLQARGMIPRAVSCGFPGCSKSSVPNMDGQRLYCTAHTRARGLRPRVVACTMPGCVKVAQPSVDGQRLYCVAHMRQQGMAPKTGGCRHEGCNKVAKLSTDGQLQYCIAHMRVNGLSPKVAVCQQPGCTKVAKAATNGQCAYCIAHMREYGLEPKVPACQNPGCTKVAKTSSDGQHTFCIAHMRERGLSPRMATCHHVGCQELASPATNKRCIYCKEHMPLYALVPKDD